MKIIKIYSILRIILCFMPPWDPYVIINMQHYNTRDMKDKCGKQIMIASFNSSLEITSNHSR